MLGVRFDLELALNYQEIPLLLPCGADSMLAILSQPERPAALGLVIVVGGPQYRVGSHRQFVLLARFLAQAGFPVLRFDYRGMGDSSGALRDFTAVDDDIAVAVDTLQSHCPAVDKVVLWGLCDGASASLLYWGRRMDPRIFGLCLVNPWVRSPGTLARTRIKHYYASRLLQGGFWRRVLQGEYEWRLSLKDLWLSLRTLRARPPSDSLTSALSFQDEMAQSLRRFKGQVLLILSGRDTTAKEFVECASSDPQWRGLLQKPELHWVDIAEADHTLSKGEWRAALEQAVLDWMITQTEA